MKKIINYMQNQAQQYSQDRHNFAANLSPSRNREPQQQQQQRYIRRRSSTGPDMDSSAIASEDGNSGGSGNNSGNSSSSSSSPLSPAILPRIKKVQYGFDNIWQSYEVYQPDETTTTTTTTTTAAAIATTTVKPKYWVVYIHGGYLRDPKVTSASFHPALSQLVDPASSSSSSAAAAIKQVQAHVAGYASINYRLAPHEGHDPGGEGSSSVPAFERRDAQWPQMLDDVLSALHHLQARYGIGEDYLLVGHSVGATLALLAALKAHDHGGSGGQASHSRIHAPLAVAGVCGIYDFEALHAKFPGYAYLTRNAIPHETDWVMASPARYSREGYDELWARGRRRWLLLAQSRTDGLVDFEQAEDMHNKVAVVVVGEHDDDDDDNNNDDSLILSDLIEIHGQHDEIWKQGDELARVVAMGVGKMISLDQ